MRASYQSSAWTLGAAIIPSLLFTFVSACLLIFSPRGGAYGALGARAYLGFRASFSSRTHAPTPRSPHSASPVLGLFDLVKEAYSFDLSRRRKPVALLGESRLLLRC